MSAGLDIVKKNYVSMVVRFVMFLQYRLLGNWKLIFERLLPKREPGVGFNR